MGSFFYKKAKLWIDGRKDLFENLSKDLVNTNNVVWFHAASLGEFEQGKSVIEAFRTKFPHYKILLTFFSPSGYEIKKNYQGADFIYYLPIDTKGNAKKFVDIVSPKIAIFIKYEFWFNYLNALNECNIPTYLISGIFRKEQHFFKWYGRWSKQALENITFLFVQDQKSLDLLNSADIYQSSISGDTRFDRVNDIAGNSKKYLLIEKFVGNNRLLLAGSSWRKDEKIIKKLADNKSNNLKFILAPHETHQTRIRSILKLFKRHEPLLFSNADDHKIKNTNVLIIDSIGILSNLYQYCDIAYIGGGFGKGIHNILEAVTFGKPVIFGTKYHKFTEAVRLIKLGGAFTVKNSNELINKTNHLLENPREYSKCSIICKDYITDNLGATQFILDKISDQLTVD